MAGKINFLSLLLVLSVHNSTVSASTTGIPLAADLQEQLDNLGEQLDQFRQEVNTKLDQSVFVRLERLERKLEEISPTVATTSFASIAVTRTNEPNATTTTTSFPKLPPAAWAQIAESNSDLSSQHYFCTFLHMYGMSF